MTTEPPKAAPAAQEHSYPPAVGYPQPYNGATYPPPGPPGAYPSPFFAYPPPPDGSHPENGQNGAPPGAPYMMFHHPHPGMVFAYPPPQGQAYAVPPNNQALPPLRPKRKQVKMACTNCAAACKRCDETRPCERCMKYGVADSCVDGQRKERKKGIKRGPYKRKNKTNSAEPSFGEFSGEPPAEGGEWTAGSQSPASTATTTAAMHAVAHQFTGEGFFPVYYPPPGPYIPHHEGQPGHEGSVAHGNGQPPMMPYYIHPGGYPPFPHYGHPAMYPPQGAPPPPPQQPQPVNTADVGKKSGDALNTTDTNGTNNIVENTETPAVAKKRARPSKTAESKAKKAKSSSRTAKNTKDDEGATENAGVEVQPSV